jgi:hypothetical protein
MDSLDRKSYKQEEQGEDAADAASCSTSNSEGVSVVSPELVGVNANDEKQEKNAARKEGNPYLRPAAKKEEEKPVVKKNKIPSRKTKKRSRKDMDDFNPLDRQMALKQDRYDKLLYMAKKQLMKQAKIVRSFMVQRNIRKLKNQNQPDKKKQGEEEEKEQQQLQLQLQLQPPQVLQPLKDLPLDLVVQQAVRQLGLIHANPHPETTVVPATIVPTDQSKLVSSVLDHKRFQSGLEEWNEKVAEFRRFCLMMDDSNNKFADSSHLLTKKRGKKGKRETTSLQPKQQQQQQQPEQASYFCSSLNESTAEPIQEGNANKKMMAYGPAATMAEDEFEKPKNRKGQRARRAKALAIEAKKTGRQYQSINWREEKTKEQKTEDFNKSRPRKKDYDGPQSKHGGDTKSTVDKKPTTEELASNHPSWAAKQQQKSGIVAFQGKKITFD